MNTDELEFESDSEVGEDMDLDRIPEDQEEDSDEVSIYCFYSRTYRSFASRF